MRGGSLDRPWDDSSDEEGPTVGISSSPPTRLQAKTGNLASGRRRRRRRRPKSTGSSSSSTSSAASRRPAHSRPTAQRGPRRKATSTGPRPSRSEIAAAQPLGAVYLPGAEGSGSEASSAPWRSAATVTDAAQPAAQRLPKTTARAPVARHLMDVIYRGRAWPPPRLSAPPRSPPPDKQVTAVPPEPFTALSGRPAKPTAVRARHHLRSDRMATLSGYSSDAPSDAPSTAPSTSLSTSPSTAPPSTGRSSTEFSDLSSTGILDEEPAVRVTGRGRPDLRSVEDVAGVTEYLAKRRAKPVKPGPPEPTTEDLLRRERLERRRLETAKRMAKHKQDQQPRQSVHEVARMASDEARFQAQAKEYAQLRHEGDALGARDLLEQVVRSDRLYHVMSV